MKRKIHSVLFILLIFILTACQNNQPLNFTGEGENWSTKVQVHLTKEKEENKEISLQYKGEDIHSVGDFEFKLDAPNGAWGMGIIQLDDEGKFVQANEVSVRKKTSRSDELIITINWNEQTEIIPLNSY